MGITYLPDCESSSDDSTPMSDAEYEDMILNTETFDSDESDSDNLDVSERINPEVLSELRAVAEGFGSRAEEMMRDAKKWISEKAQESDSDEEMRLVRCGDSSDESGEDSDDEDDSDKDDYSDENDSGYDIDDIDKLLEEGKCHNKVMTT